MKIAILTDDTRMDLIPSEEAIKEDEQKQKTLEEVEKILSTKYDCISLIAKEDIIEKLKMASKSNSNVFIYGETETGKELFAHSIHNESNRNNKPFIAQNCAAIPEILIESIFFGTTKGSFTGAEDKKGLFEASDGGTVFKIPRQTLYYKLNKYNLIDS